MRPGLAAIVERFQFEGDFLQVAPYGLGHINDTYIARFRKADGAVRRYILQRINHDVFKNPEELMRVLLERERLGSTGIGGGIGIPHGKLKDLDSLVLGFGLSRNGVDFESIDGQPTRIFFILITPENSTGLHLKLLARISRILKNDPFKERLMNAADGDDIFNIIKEEDEEF